MRSSFLDKLSTDGTVFSFSQEDNDAPSVNSFKNCLDRKCTHQKDFFKDTSLTSPTGCKNKKNIH